MASSEQDTLTKIKEAEMKLCRGQDMKDDMVMALAPYANWEEMIHPAPLSIALLGHLMLISSERDFTLITNDKNSFVYLHHPNSFRASLVQVGNEGWEAFNAAHKNMDEIRMLTGRVPTHVENAVKILLSGTNEEVALVLPKILGNVQRIANDCTDRAEEVETAFVRVMKVIAEVLEACTSAKGNFDAKFEETKIAIEVAREHEKAAHKEKEISDEMFKELQKQVRECQQEYRDAIKAMPSTLGLVGMSVVEGVGKACNTVISGVMDAFNVFSIFRGVTERIIPKQCRSQASMAVAEIPYDIAQFKVLNKIPLVVKCFSDLQNVVSQLQTTSHGQHGFDEVLHRARANLLRVKVELDERPTTEMIRKLSEIADNTIALIHKVLEWSRQMNRDPNELENIQRSVSDLNTSVEYLRLFSTMASSNASLNRPLPRQAKSESLGSTSGLTRTAIENARFRVHQASQMLTTTMQQYDQVNKRVQESNKELGKLLADLAKYDLQKVDFENIRKTLIRGMKALGQVREQWGKLVRFFQMMAAIIKCNLQEALTDFKENVNCGRELRYTMSDMMRDMIYQQATEANKIAYVVNILSGTYVEVSNKYLMDSVASLGKLIALDAEEDKYVIQQKHRELTDGVQKTVKAINTLVQERREEMIGKMQARVHCIETEMGAVLPPPPPGREDEIKETEKKVTEDLAQWV